MLARTQGKLVKERVAPDNGELTEQSVVIGLEDAFVKSMRCQGGCSNPLSELGTVCHRWSQ